MSRSKNVACVPLGSSFSSNYYGYIHLKDFENSSWLFVAQRFEQILNMLRLKKEQKQICPEKSKVNTLSDSNILFEHHISYSKITIFDQERNYLEKVSLA